MKWRCASVVLSFNLNGRREGRRSLSTVSRTWNVRLPRNPLHLLQRCDTLPSLRSSHSLLIVTGTHSDPHLLGELIRRYIRLGTPEMAIHVYLNAKDTTLALRNLTFSAFAPLIKACAAAKSPPLIGKAAHCRALRTGYEGDVVVQTALVDMYFEMGHVGSARKVFDGMPQRDLVSWNALLFGYLSNGLDDEVLRAFGRVAVGGLRPNASTLVSVIPACTRLGEVGAGRSLHCLAIRSGLVNAPSLTPTLISMYAAFGDVADAELLFETMPKEDVVAWNAMISAYAHNGRGDEAYGVFRRMQCSDVRPQSISFVSLLPACGNALSHCFGEAAHALVIKYGFGKEVPVATSLTSMYAKLGDLDAARFLFGSISERNLLTWNSIVSGFVSNERPDLALDTFVDMQLARVTPDAISMIGVLSACGKLENVLLGKSVHAFCLRNGFRCCQNVMNALITMYSDCGQLSLSLKLFQVMQCKNLSSWNALISGSAQLGKFEMAMSLFVQMQSENIKFDIVCLISIIPIFGQLGYLGIGMSFHGHAIRSGYDSGVSLGNALACMYMSCGDIKAGYRLFDTMTIKDVVSWNVIMTGFRNHNLYIEVIGLFMQMRACGETPNRITLLNLFPSCTSQLIGKSAHGYALRNFGVLDDSIVTSIMCMYSKFENLDSCLALFRFANKRNIVVWNTMISILAQSQHGERVMLYFHQLLDFRLEPDDVTTLNLVSAAAQLGCSDLAQNITGYIVKKGFDKTVVISNALIDTLARCGEISLAKGIFESLGNKDLISWSAMMNGYGMHGKGEAALALFSEMKEAGIEPDSVAFLGLLSACSHSGLLEQGRNIFRSMREEHHVLPRQELFACMVDLLGRTGHLEEAYDLIKRAPFKPTSSIIESLLGACNFYGNSELGEELGRMLSESEPGSSCSLVMLSKIYAEAGRWMDSCSIRSDMEVRGLRKVPGLSLITVNL